MSQARGGSGLGGGKERRQFPRVEQAFGAQVRTYGDLGATWSAVTAVNLSASGIRFRCEETIKPGTMLELQFQLPGISQPLSLRGVVVWSTLQASGVIETGVEFLDLHLPQQHQMDQLVRFLRKR